MPLGKARLMRTQDFGKVSDAVKPHASVPRRVQNAAGPVLSCGAHLTPGAVAALQRSAGNAAVAHVLQRRAHQHGAGSSPGPQTADEAVGSAVGEVLRSRGRSLPESVQRDAESRLGTPKGIYRSVEIHDSPKDIDVSRSIGAIAFTSGNDIVGDVSRSETFYHELHHIRQQQLGPVPGTDMSNGLKVSDRTDHAEREAAAVGVRAAAAPSLVQRTTGVPRVRAVVGVGGTVVQRARGGAQTASRRVDGDQLLDIIVGRGDRTLAGFIFGPGSRNNEGKNLISRPVEIEVRDGDTTARLAVHLNVMLNTGGAQPPRDGTTTVPIEMKLFHVTARRSKIQKQMTDAGSFQEGADESVHVGRSNADKGWNNRPENMARLAQSADVSPEALINALEGRFPPDKVADLIERFKWDAGRAVVHALEPPVVHVQWTGDKSCD